MRPSWRPVAALAAAALCLLVAACDGGSDADDAPEQLSRADARALMAAREGLDDAIDTEETLRTSPAQARKLRGRVQAIASEGAFEAEELDEFGLAALGRLQLVVPSLVETDADGVAVALDRAAARAFLRYAERDPARALLGPAQDAVDSVERVVRRSKAGTETRIPPRQAAPAPELTVGAFLREAEADTKRIWPGLSSRLRSLYEGLQP